MPRTVSSIWKKFPKNIFSCLEACLDTLNNPVDQGAGKVIFFRADDVAVPSDNFSRLVSLFLRYRVPLSLAVVPAWLTVQRWGRLKELTGDFPSLWCWHQHGWRHVNHSMERKKYEFGQSRSYSQIKNDLKNGMNRLKNIMGKDFYPIFTPPWNRCDDQTLRELKNLKFKAISRSSGNRSEKVDGITEYNVNVDLHTRKEKNPEEGWNYLFETLKQSLASGLCGIMVHHQLMNAEAFLFLESLFEVLADKSDIKTVHLKDLVENYAADKKIT